MLKLARVTTAHKLALVNRLVIVKYSSWIYYLVIMNFKANIFETVLAVITLLSTIGLVFYFYSLVSPSLTEDNPFKEFDFNSGIIKISISAFVVRIVFLSSFVLLYSKGLENSRKILTVYLLSALLIGFLQWFELYYGSTFYYGEVRDKQGLMFPVLASLMVTLVLWKINYFRVGNEVTTIKVILSLLVNASLYFLWIQVSEPWNLLQS